MYYKLLAGFGAHTYYPNMHHKKCCEETLEYLESEETQCEGCKGFNCDMQNTRSDGKTPSNASCWAYSFWWHLRRAKECHGTNACMVQIVENGKLGRGQELELAMANRLGIKVVRIDWNQGISIANACGDDVQSHRI